MVKVANVFFFLILCGFAYAADSLTLYTDPDFPDFSFEYDSSVWTIEQVPVDPNDITELKVVKARSLYGQEVITFSFEAPI